MPTGSQTASRPYGGVSVEALDDGRLAVVSTQNAAGRGTLSISTPEVDGWETTVEVPAGTRANGDGGLVEPRVVVAGDAVIVLGGTAVAYDVATGAWRDLAGMPGALVDDSTMPATWTGAEVLVGGFAYDPAVDEWWALAEPPMPLTSRPVATWAGTELVLWGGSFTCTRDEATGMCVESDEELYPADGLALRPD